MTDEEKIKIKPLSANAFVAFFQRIARGWLGGWYTFSEKHPRLSAYVYKLFFFLLFSGGVTIWQYIVMTFLPYAFKGLNNGAWGFPNVPVNSAGGEPYVLFGDASGLGYFIAFEIAVFTAQCINFPLQRNITFKSHGNAFFQAMWYFIGWVLISVFTNAVWGIVNCYFIYLHVPDAVSGLVKTIITGGVSFVIFFFIFLVIFPDREKQAKSAKKKYERARAKSGDESKIKVLEEKYLCAQELADRETARKNLITAGYLANSKAIAWEQAVKKLDKLMKKGADEDKIAAQQQTADSRKAAALAAAERFEELSKACAQ